MRSLSSSLLALGLVATSFSLVSAQEVQDRLRQGVLDRDRPAYDARGMRVGSFLLYPALDVDFIYDDNIFATDTGKVDDVVIQERPSLGVESNFSRHAVFFRGDMRHQNYLDNNSENRTDYFLTGGGRLDITKTTNIFTQAEFQNDSEDRGSPDAIGLALDPVDFNHSQVVTELRHRPGRLSLDVGGIFQKYNFDDVGLFGGGVQNNDDRDRTLGSGYTRVGYEVSPGYQFFVLGMYTSVNYRLPVDDNGFDRDSKGFQFEGGTRVELTNVVAGEFSVGYVKRNYDDPLLVNVKGLSTEAKIEWYASRLTTVLFGASRRIQETTIDNAAGYIETSLNAGVDHELRRNVILSANVRYDMRDYKGIARQDDQVEVMARGIYFLNRNLSLAAEYRHRTRDSNAPGEDYGRNITMLTLRAQI